MNFRPDTSFPYLAIAHQYDVPYVWILNWIEALEIKGGLTLSPAILPAWAITATDVWAREGSRRKKVRNILRKKRAPRS
jgi:hypothetical protein